MTRSGYIFGPVGPVGSGNPPMSPTYQKADKQNREGFPAFTRTLEEDVLSVLLTQTLSNTFYCSQKELAKETVDVLRAMADKDPEFLAKALAYARTKGLMKLAPTVGLAVLASKKTSNKKEAFRLAFRQVVKIPDDLREFVTLLKTKQFTKGLVGIPKTMVQNWLRHMSEYHAVKYGSANSEGITLRDILRLAHPRPKTTKPNKGLDYERLRNGAQAELFGWLVKGWSEIGTEPSPTNPMVWALEKLKRTDSVVESVALIEKYKLPREVVEPSVKKMTEAHWAALLKNLPYMALLRNLNTMLRHGVFEVKETVKKVAKHLADPENVQKSKQFPFRFWNAFKALKAEAPQELRDALSDALEASFVNMPLIKGRVCLFNDISSSMDSKVSDKSDTTLSEIAAMFAAATLKRCEDEVLLVPFDDVAHPELGKVSRRDSMMSIVKQIGITRGGTNLGAPIEYLLKKKIAVDVLIGFTDNEDWAGRGFLTYFEQYKREINPKAKAFLVTLAPYRDYVAPAGYPDVYFIMGWSESILRYIPLMLEGGVGQVEDVRNIDLRTYGKKEAVEETAEAVAED